MWFSLRRHLNDLPFHKLHALAATQGQAATAAPAAPVAPAPPAPPMPGAQAGTEDRVALLERLAKLREQGLLTDAEFEAEKQRILES